MKKYLFVSVMLCLSGCVTTKEYRECENDAEYYKDLSNDYYKWISKWADQRLTDSELQDLVNNAQNMRFIRATILFRERRP